MSRRVSVEFLERRVLLSTAKLDVSFSGVGYTIGPTEAPSAGPFFSTAEALAELPNGQTLIAGQISVGNMTGIYVRRYNDNGSVDETFGAGDGYQGASGYSFIGGTLSPGNVSGQAIAVARLAVGASGNIVVGEANFGIVRLNSGGAVDDSFGDNGFISVPTLVDIAITNSSQIVASESQGMVEQFTSAGLIDTAFGSNGQTQLSITSGTLPYSEYPGTTPILMPITIQTDGDILIGGMDAHADLAVERISGSGSVDQSFGSDGVASAGFNSFMPNSENDYNASQADALAILNNGDIVVGGVAFTDELNSGPNAFIAAEFLPDGQLNTGFATGGQIGQVITSGNSETYLGCLVESVLPESDGDVVFAGSTFDAGNTNNFVDESSFVLLAVTSSGEFDASFGENGELTTQFTAAEPDQEYGPTDLMYGAENTPDGKVMAVGNASPVNEGPGAVLAKFIVLPPPPSLTMAGASAVAGTDVNFVVSLSSVATEAVTATYTLTSGTAPSSDFDDIAGVVTIPEAATSATIHVPTYGDFTGSTEQFTITLSSLSSNAAFSNGEATESATGTITPMGQIPVASQTLLSASPTTIQVGESVTLNAEVSGGTTTPTGMVTFYENGSVIGTSGLDDTGNTSLQVTLSSVGPDTFTAGYGGGASYQASSSSPVVVGVNSLASVTTITAFATTLVVGQFDTLDVAVTPESGDGPVPTGNVIISQDGVARGTYPLASNGTVYVTYDISTAASSTQLSASYNGDANYSSSVSTSVDQSFLPASSATPAVVRAEIPANAVAGQRYNAAVPIKITSAGATLKGKFVAILYLDGSAEGLNGNPIELKSISEKTTLKDGASLMLPFSVKSLPASLTPGAYHFVAEVKDPSGGVSIVTSVQSVVVSKPFVSISAAFGGISPLSLKPGRVASAIISVTNNGNIIAHGLLRIKIIAADPANASSSLTLATVTVPAAISVTATKQYRIRIVIPKTAAAVALTPSAEISLADSSIEVSSSYPLQVL